MLLFFVRHAETVDNVAGIYAGVTDSELTNHGVMQTRQLGSWMKECRPAVTKVFASPLQRTSRTAKAIIDAQQSSATSASMLVKSSLLIEKDFGSYEGTSFSKLPPDPHKIRRVAHAEQHRSDPGFRDVESSASMDQRCDRFLDQHLVPAMLASEIGGNSVIVIVSHGMLLSHLWRRFLLRLPRRTISIAAEVTSARGHIVLEHLGGWSNTGCLELKVTLAPRGSGSSSLSHSHVREASHSHGSLPVVSVRILEINGQEHLKGLKRARGGIGSAKYDEGQRSLDSFFKRAKK